MGYQALLFCPDEKLARVVSQVFSELEFTVDPVSEPFAAVKKLIAQRYDAVVVDCDNEQNTSLLFKSAHNSSVNQGALAIAVVEGQAGVAKAYRIGANLVLTKPINVEQAKGTLRVARGLLKKNSDGAASTASPAPAVPVKTAPAPAISTPSPNRSVEAVAAPPTRREAAPFEPSFPAVAASTKVDTAIEAKVEPTVSAEIADVPAPVAQAKPHAFVQEPAGTTLFDAEEARNESGKSDAHKAGRYSSTITSTLHGAAAAPAPAKETVPAAKIVEQEAETPRKDSEKSSESDSTTTAHTSDAANAASTSDGLSFAALGDEDAGGSGSKKFVIIAVAVLALAAAGYFGWTKFGQPNSNATPQTVAPQRTQPTANPVSTSAPAPAAQTSATDAVIGTTSASSPKISISAQPSADTSSEARISIESAPETKKPAPAPILVKSPSPVAKPQSQADEPTPQLPSPLAVTSSGDSDLSGLVSTSSPNPPRPTLAKIRVSQGVSQGLLIKRVQPKYPASAQASHIQGAVEIEATINKEGNVINPRVLKGDAILAAAALQAVRQWRYKPYFLDGAPVEIQTQITINFKAD